MDIVNWLLFTRILILLKFANSILQEFSQNISIYSAYIRKHEALQI